MSYFNNKHFGSEAKVLIETPYYQVVGESGPLPPPGQELMITENGIYMITETLSQYMVTE